ncbi:MAG: isoprenylcysteine carboxylmethyltransferase family protein [Bacteroidales bacterium]|nr:isoprenylcysteine carboxylmethyltransferase family protein [Bacteroidales bacterium]
MNLKDSFVYQGNLLFKYRSYFPLILFVLAVPFIYVSSRTSCTLKNEIILIIFSILVSISGFIVRAFVVGSTPKGTSGRNTKSQVAETLNSSGIYSVVRHPLYLGNFLIWAGIVIFTFSLYFFIVFCLLFWIYYERIMVAEEDFLNTRFGDNFQMWSQQTPAFFPSFKNYQKSQMSFSFRAVLRREYSGLLATAVSFTFVDLWRLFFTEKNIYADRISIYVLGVILIITLVLRTLKHSTKILSS